jgi:uncharacterized Zn finger protein (UPF0148 family)
LEKINEVIIDYKGSIFKTLKREDGRFYCPICGAGENAPIFFTESDLIRHICNHDQIKKALAKKKKE